MKISCIYKITNIINNKIYIGSTSNFKDRKSRHFSELKNSRHINNYLQNSYNKYGKDSFKIEIVEECKIEDLYIKEEHYSKIYNSFSRELGYNICPVPSKEKIELPKETRLKISIANINSFKNGRSKNHISKLTAKKVYIYKNNTLIKVYNSGAEVAKDYNTTHNRVSAVISRSKGKLINNKKAIFNGLVITHNSIN